MSKIHKTYVSPIDEKLAKFNAEHKDSPAQKTEREKYARIYELRDNMQLNMGQKQQNIEDLLD